MHRFVFGLLCGGWFVPLTICAAVLKLTLRASGVRGILADIGRAFAGRAPTRLNQPQITLFRSIAPCIADQPASQLQWKISSKKITIGEPALHHTVEPYDLVGVALIA